jgi:hypothetical protein
MLSLCARRNSQTCPTRLVELHCHGNNLDSSANASTLSSQCSAGEQKDGFRTLGSWPHPMPMSSGVPLFYVLLPSFCFSSCACPRACVCGGGEGGFTWKRREYVQGGTELPSPKILLIIIITHFQSGPEKDQNNDTQQRGNFLPRRPPVSNVIASLQRPGRVYC